MGQKEGRVGRGATEFMGNNCRLRTFSLEHLLILLFNFLCEKAKSFVWKIWIILKKPREHSELSLVEVQTDQGIMRGRG